MPVTGDWLSQAASATTDKLMLPPLWRAMFLPQQMPERFERDFSFDLAGTAGTSISTGEDAVAITTALWRSVWSYSSCRLPVRILGGDADLVINNTVHGAALARLLPSGRFETLPGLGHMAHHFAKSSVVEAVRAIGQ